LEDINKKGYTAVTRNQSFTAQYAAAVREIATEFNDRKLVLVDLWAALMKEGLRRSPGHVEGGALLGAKENGDSMGLRAFLVDGLHLTGLAYALFLNILLPLLEPSFTEGHEDTLPWVFP
jgi:lysophospholipase L1-like esterase